MGPNGFSRMYYMFFIPAQMYLQAIASWFILYIFIRIEAYAKRKRTYEESTTFVQPSPLKQALYVCGFMVIYALFICTSYALHQADVPYVMTSVMIGLTFFFSLGACIGMMFLKEVIGPANPIYKKESNKVHDSSSAEYTNDVFEKDEKL